MTGMGKLATFIVFQFLKIVEAIEVTIDTQTVVQQTNDQFVSVTIDSSVLRKHWENFNPRSVKVKTLAAALVPCYLRLGGTDADFLIFDDEFEPSVLPEWTNNIDFVLGMKSETQNTGTDLDWTLNTGKNNDTNDMFDRNIVIEMNSDNAAENGRRKRDIGSNFYMQVLKNFTMHAKIYDELHKFVSDVGWHLIFDLNVLLRDKEHWDPLNALKLFNYTIAKGFKVAGWELGNEPDDFSEIFVNFTLPPEQLAKDYITLHTLIQQFAEFRDCLLLGPSVAQLSVDWRIQYFESFLESGGGQVVTAATFHQYYVDGATATLEQFYNPDVLNFLSFEVETGVNITKKSGSKASVWLGETSSAWNSGAEDLSDRYVAGFMWLDKLGIAAKGGIAVVMRQSFYGGYYGLLDAHTLDPNPDYWLTLLYKQLVGIKVLRVTSPDSKGTLRAYAHCTNPRSGYDNGSIVIYAINIDSIDVNITIADFDPLQLVHVYTFLPENGDLQSKTVMLNGKVLRMLDNRTLPDLMIPVKSVGPVLLPAYSYSFIVIPEADMNVCK